MEIAQGNKTEIEEIIERIECRRDFECYKSGFQKLCKAHIIGPGALVECLGENQRTCGFSLPLYDTYFCNCPLRVHIAKKFDR